MEAMPKPRLPYLHRYKTRHGKFIWYVRRPGEGRARIRETFGTPEFEARYRAIMNGLPVTQAKAPTPTGTVGWLWERYHETAAWTALKASTKRQRENIMARVIANGGADSYRDITPAIITAGRDRRAKTPSQAKGFLVCMRAMFRWALQAGHVKVDPTVGIKGPSKAKGEGFPVWTEADIDAYEARWPLGTKERVWLDVILYTGLRRGDAVRVGKQHVRNGIVTIRTEKGQGEVIVSFPILAVLARTLAAGPCGDMTFICGASGKPLKKESFGNMFREACDAAGVTGKSAHGIRKAAATRAADNGASETELEAIFGWHGGGMASLYTRAANRKRAALRAMSLMEKPSCQPDDEVSTAEKIRK